MGRNLRPKIFSISCSFYLENLAKLYVGAPCKVGAPPTGNAGTAPAVVATADKPNRAVCEHVRTVHHF